MATSAAVNGIVLYYLISPWYLFLSVH
uniref:Uncharacterized protein n=1 Tax=Arundo donax TaxID=35708 RepID=A0A0A9CSZ4_ARUDO